MVEPISDSMFIAYDGPDEAKRALAYARRLLRVKKAYILIAWEPLQRATARTAGASGVAQSDWDAITGNGDPTHDETVRICHEGAQITAGADFVTEPCLVEAKTIIWSTIADAAHDLDVGVIISGTRGVTGLCDLFTALTSDTLLKNTGRPVLVVSGGKE